MLAWRQRTWLMLRALAAWLHAARKLAQRHAKACAAWGRIEATILAYERSVVATDSAAAREHSNICDSITNRHLSLACGPNPPRLPPASEALAVAGEAGGCHSHHQGSCGRGVCQQGKSAVVGTRLVWGVENNMIHGPWWEMTFRPPKDSLQWADRDTTTRYDAQKKAQASK